MSAPFGSHVVPGSLTQTYGRGHYIAALLACYRPPRIAVLNINYTPQISEVVLSRADRSN